MQKICSVCHYIGKEVRITYINIVAPICLIIFGVGTLNYFYSISIIDLFTPLIWLVFGIYSLIIFIDRPYECPNCKKNRTMIPLDTPRAQALIKEHNLTIPEEAQQQPASPKTSQ